MKERFSRKMICLIALAGSSLLSGCAMTGGPNLAIGPETAENILLPPSSPRMKYLYSIRGAQEEERRKRSDVTWGGEEPQAEQPFKSPIAITEVRKGVFYLVDQANSVIFSIEPEKREWRIVELRDGEPLSSLVGIAVDESGAVYLTDSVLKKVLRLRAGGGKAEGFAGDFPFGRPTGIVFNPANKNVYVVDTLSNEVFGFDLSGRKILEFGKRGTGPGEFNYPTYIAVDRQGNLFVSDTLNFRIQSFTPDGKFRFSFGSLGDDPGEFSAPKGVAVSAAGFIYVNDGRLDRVQVFSPKGEHLFSFGFSGTAPGQFWLPNGIYVDERDRVYVCDYLNNRVQVFQYLGER